MTGLTSFSGGKGRASSHRRWDGGMGFEEKAVPILRMGNHPEGELSIIYG
jgi:hypothetical protein